MPVGATNWGSLERNLSGAIDGDSGAPLSVFAASTALTCSRITQASGRPELVAAGIDNAPQKRQRFSSGIAKGFIS